jgi:hypothetical protein
MRTKALTTTGAALIATLAFVVSATAAVPGTLALDQTYPVASALCAKASAGTLPPRLAHSDAAVLTACATLSNGFTPLVNTVTSAESQFTQTIANSANAVAAACPTPLMQADRPACHAARVQARLTNAQARLARRTAAETYRNSVETNRLAFWSTITSLRGSSSTTSSS